MKINFATTNKGKIHALDAAFKLLSLDIKVIEQHIDIPEIRSDNVTEIAEDKVITAYNTLKQSVVAQDGGIFIPALNDFPGTYTHYVMKAIGLEGLIRLMKGQDNQAEYRDVLAYMSPELKKPVSFLSHVKGKLIDTPRGNLNEKNWGILHLIFVPDGYNKTIAEMTDEEVFAWREGSLKNFCTTQFAQWFKENKYE